jgi:hypothetical protein
MLSLPVFFRQKIWLGRQNYAGLRPSPLRGRLRYRFAVQIRCADLSNLEVLIMPPNPPHLS